MKRNNMDRAIRKRVQRSIIQHADQMVVILANGERRLLSSFCVRDVFRLMHGALSMRAMHGFIPPREKPLPTIHAPGIH